MEEMGVTILKLFLFTFGSLGIIFHLLSLISTEEGKKMEEGLGTEIGCNRRFIHGLERNRMNLQEKLMKSKAYHTLTSIFLVALLVFLFQV